MPVVGERFTAVCSANITASVTGQIVLEWRDERGRVINSSSGSNNVQTEFSIDKFTFGDSSKIGGFQCWAIVSTAEQMDVTLCQNILFTRELHIEIQHLPTHIHTHTHTHTHISPATLASTAITTSGDFTAGSRFKLTCTVMGAMFVPMIMWFGPRGLIFSDGDGIEVGPLMEMGNTYSRSLTFTALSADETGEYQCFNTVILPPSVEHTVFIGSRLTVYCVF